MGNSIITKRIKGIKQYSALENISQYNVGDFLIIKTEFDNPYDSHALAVYDINNNKLGYIDKYSNQEIYLKIKDAKYICVITQLYVDEIKPSIEFQIIYETTGTNEEISNNLFNEFYDKYKLAKNHKESNSNSVSNCNKTYDAKQIENELKIAISTFDEDFYYKIMDIPKVLNIALMNVLSSSTIQNFYIQLTVENIVKIKSISIIDYTVNNTVLENYCYNNKIEEDDLTEIYIPLPKKYLQRENDISFALSVETDTNELYTTHSTYITLTEHKIEYNTMERHYFKYYQFPFIEFLNEILDVSISKQVFSLVPNYQYTNTLYLSKKDILQKYNLNVNEDYEIIFMYGGCINYSTPLYKIKDNEIYYEKAKEEVDKYEEFHLLNWDGENISLVYITSNITCGFFELYNNPDYDNIIETEKDNIKEMYSFVFGDNIKIIEEIKNQILDNIIDN